MRCFEKLNTWIFVPLENQANAEKGIILRQKKMFSGIKCDFFRILIPGDKYRIEMTHSLLERNFCDVISLKAEKPIT